MSRVIEEMWRTLGGAPDAPARVEIVGDRGLRSAFAVSDLAVASIGVAAEAVAELIAARHGQRPQIRVDRRLASLWFGFSMHPLGWSAPSPWDPIAGDYRTSDGWIRLHTNAPHHRAAALNVLGVAADKDAVERAVAAWNADDLETAIVERGGCAAIMRSVSDWRDHAQGRAVAAEPVLRQAIVSADASVDWPIPPARPLQGIRVLDLTRVLAGPVATRFLAGYGAEVLRIDPPWWDEPSVVPEVTLGKRCARLDLRQRGDRDRFEHLLSDADVLVHGYRPGAFDRLGFDAAWRRAVRPGLVDVSLDAYGWSGPWRARRGFDSLVQMSTGIAEAGMRHFGRAEPTPLPVQALDHATGYLMAAAVIGGLTRRLIDGVGTEAQTSLARMAQMLGEHPSDGAAAEISPRDSRDYADAIEVTEWGRMQRLLPPVVISGAPMQWDRPAEPLGASTPRW